MPVAQVQALPKSAQRASLPPFELSGAENAPVILALGGISADRHVYANDRDGRSGWWESVVGPDRAIDTRRVCVLGVDFIDGGVRHDGRPERIVTTRDQADAIAAVVHHLDVERLHAIVGASYGGMVGLALAERYPELVDRLVVIGAAHRTHPLTTAWRVIQRRIVELGLESGRVREALALARALAITTYRSRDEFAARFGVAATSLSEDDATFPVERYLDHQGDKFARRFSAARFLALSLSSDLHAVDPASIQASATLIAEEGDLIVPREDIVELARDLGGHSEVLDLSSTRGHDAFLTEPERLGGILRQILFTRSLT